MPRRKKAAASTDAASSSVKPEKKKKRVGVAVRVLKEKAKPAAKAVPPVADIAAPAVVATTPAVSAAPVVPPVELAPAPAKPAPQEPAPLQPQAASDKPSRPYSDKEKAMIMWTAVIFIMIMVFGLWFMSIKLQLQSESVKQPANEFDFKKVSEDISSAMREANESLKQLASTTPTSTPEAATSTVDAIMASSTGVIATTTSLDEAAIQNTIKELEAQINRATTTATSTAR